MCNGATGKVPKLRSENFADPDELQLAHERPQNQLDIISTEINQGHSFNGVVTSSTEFQVGLSPPAGGRNWLCFHEKKYVNLNTTSKWVSPCIHLHPRC